MSIFFYIMGILIFLFGALIFGGAKSTFHEMEAFILFLISAVFISSAAIIRTIKQSLS